MKMSKVSDLFEITYGTNLVLSRLEQYDKHNENTVNFVSRTAKNNGVSAIVKRIDKIKPLERGLITVALGSNGVMESFVQPYEFYSGRDVCYLTPKNEMTLREKLFYCICLRKNKYRYNYGRQANRSLKDILIPSNVPEWVYTMKIPAYLDVEKKYSLNNKKKINVEAWKGFKYEELFDIENGRGVLIKEAKRNKGDTPLVSATRENNGVSYYVSFKPTHQANTITVVKNGNSVAEAFYQSKPFCATSDVVVLNPKFELNEYIAMFLITLMRKEKYRFNYGRKWNQTRMNKSIIKLPAQNNKPDWTFIENYIKSLKYSKLIASDM
ncbi:restriction endonuclease subunit S [Crassaminicella indica]|uniref:Restriction endonuclease subunit S n=1 Tax=Crassaminicella indica TaxID=2855394 RepID=A0ABX8R9U2_9CLOT|nr:restriction endonuclease subunit S [Crassaminicella indica]QXM05817.1 restriction endonuclease subunit S [Crassaminicella indica]